ncbi:MAG: ATP-binding cassette domain-containing protein, partial [Verrucomicrobiota bacterium]
MAKPLLDVRGVRKSFGERCVLDGVNLSVDEGDARFLIGPNGAGKSTLLRVITGFMQADAGQVCFDETPLTRLPAYRRHRLGVSQTFQVPQLVGEQTVEDTLLMCMVEELPLWQAMWLTRPSSERLAAVEDTLKKLDVMELAGKPLREIPHGTRKLIEFGA